MGLPMAPGKSLGKSPGKITAVSRQPQLLPSVIFQRHAIGREDLKVVKPGW